MKILIIEDEYSLADAIAATFFPMLPRPITPQVFPESSYTLYFSWRKSMNKAIALEMKGVTKTFGPVVANNDVNMTVYKGEILAILGENGCGKTTLLRLIAGFQTTSEGEIRIAGDEITQTPPHMRPVNTVFQKQEYL